VAKAEVDVMVPPEQPPEPKNEEDEAEILEDDAEAEALTEIPPDEPDPDEPDDDGEVEPDDEEVEPEPEAPTGPPEPPGPMAGLDVLLETKVFKTFLAQIGQVAGVARVLVDIDGWHVKVVDPAHVAMISVDLPFKSLVSTRSFWAANAPADGPETPETVEFGLDVEKLVKKLKAVKDDQIRFVYENDEKGGRTTLEMGRRKDSIGMLDTSGMSEPKIPAMTLPAVFRIPAKLLIAVVKAAGEISDHIALTVEYDAEQRLKLVTEAEGDVDKTREEFQTEVDWVGNDGEKHRSVFPLDYLSDALKGLKDETLTVHMGTDHPLRIDWDGATKGTYLLAPRIESDG
jgi:proliferating cell nuclear antigen